MNDTNHISLTFSDAELRNLIEEYITQQNAEFTFEGVCSYIAYWAKQFGKSFLDKVSIC